MVFRTVTWLELALMVGLPCLLGAAQQRISESDIAVTSAFVVTRASPQGHASVLPLRLP